MSNISAMAFAISILSGGAALAQQPHRASMTCEEFLSVDTLKQPEIVYWAQGLKK